MELVTLTDIDMNKDVTIFLNLESDREWISGIVKVKSGSQSKREVNSSGRLESKKPLANLLVLSVFVRMIWIEI